MFIVSSSLAACYPLIPGSPAYNGCFITFWIIYAFVVVVILFKKLKQIIFNP